MLLSSFTTDREIYYAIINFMQDAIEDGWENDRGRMSKDGYKLHACAKKNKCYAGEVQSYYVQLNLWGPDGLAIELQKPYVYSMDSIKRATRKCMLCGARNVDTYRYSFAGRCCEDCLPEAKQQFERNGWTN